MSKFRGRASLVALVGVAAGLAAASPSIGAPPPAPIPSSMASNISTSNPALVSAEPRIGALGTLCAGIYEIPLHLGPRAGRLCTHGADPVDVSPVRKPPVPGTADGVLLGEQPEPPGPGRADAPPRTACYDDGLSGKRVVLAYARSSDRPDRYLKVLPSLRRWAAEADAVFASSAAKFGATRHIRFVTDSKCVPRVENIVLTPAGDDTFAATTLELASKGYDRPDRKYLVWTDAAALCGVGTVYVHDVPEAEENYNNGHPASSGQVARVDTLCWGQGPIGHSVEAHELLHTMGGVQPTAPNGSAANHCDDDSDLMCYEDGTVLELLDVCPAADEGIFDCNGDDYFNPAPDPTSYLATHWNTAGSDFLANTPGKPTVEIADAGIVEGDSGKRDLIFTVSLGTPAPVAATVAYTTAATEAKATSDYTGQSGTLTFLAGETAKTIAVAVVGDTTDEADERFRVALSKPTGGAVISRADGYGTIVDDDPRRTGFWHFSDRGVVSSFGSASRLGSVTPPANYNPAQHEIAAMAAKPGGGGYWLVSRVGVVHAFGNAVRLGSVTADDLYITAMVASPGGKGYAVVNYDGRVFPFGDAADLGLDRGIRVAETILGAARTPSGGGYWLAGEGGTVYAYGDAPKLGSLATPPASPVYGFGATPSGQGYWLAAGDGTITGFGDAPNLGSVPAGGATVVAVAGTPTGKGYWVIDVTGRVRSFGDATSVVPPSASAAPVRVLGAVPLR